MKKLVMLKIGGGVITDKNVRYGLKEEVLSRIAGEVEEAYREMEGVDLIIGNGAGSYAHWSAKEYATANGFEDDRGRVGAGRVRHDAVKLNQIVTEALLSREIPAFSFSPSSMLRVINGEVKTAYMESLRDALKQHLVPVVYGDVVVDSKRGSGIFSTERVFKELSSRLVDDYSQIRIIHVSSEEGVRVKGEVVSEINTSNFEDMSIEINGSDGVDVTGGMIHKVKESLELSAKGIESLIVSGIVPTRVRSAILGNNVVGTVLR